MFFENALKLAKTQGEDRFVTYRFMAITLMACPAMAADAFVLFLDKKNQKSIQQIGFSAARAFALLN